jgi:hypothetical protein
VKLLSVVGSQKAFYHQGFPGLLDLEAPSADDLDEAAPHRLERALPRRQEKPLTLLYMRSSSTPWPESVPQVFI